MPSSKGFCHACHGMGRNAFVGNVHQLNKTTGHEPIRYRVNPDTGLCKTPHVYQLITSFLPNVRARYVNLDQGIDISFTACPGYNMVDVCAVCGHFGPTVRTFAYIYRMGNLVGKREVVDAPTTINQVD